LVCREIGNSEEATLADLLESYIPGAQFVPKFVLAKPKDLARLPLRQQPQGPNGGTVNLLHSPPPLPCFDRHPLAPSMQESPMHDCERVSLGIDMPGKA
jgi:hypothetical protein